MKSDEKKSAKAPVPGQQLSKKQRFKSLNAQLVADRQSYISHWHEIARVLLPRRTSSTPNRGDRRNRHIIDCTATLSLRTAVSGMMSGITPRSRPWFRMTTPDEQLAERSNVKQWLDDVTKSMATALLKSNFYNAISVYYGDLLGFGTAAMLVDDDDEHVIRCYSFEIGTYCLGNDDKMRCRVFSREFKMTVRQLVAKFGYEKLSASAKNAWDAANTEAWFPVLHVICANDEADPAKMDSRFKPFASCYLQGDAEGFLSERGYDEYPVLATRWSVGWGDAYGTNSPGIMALDDINQLQFGEKKGMQALEKELSPPLVGPASLMGKRVSALPGDLTYDDTAANQGLRPLYQVRANLEGLERKQEQVRSRIEKAFFVDVFMMLAYREASESKQPLTAAETAARQEEKMTVLAPLLEHLDEECFTPLMNRLFGIMLRRGMFPEPPKELEGTDLKVEYISIAHAAQKAAGIVQVERFAMFAANLAKETSDPSVLDVVNMDEVLDEYADASGVSPRVVRSAEDIQAKRQKRAQAQQTQQRVEMLKQAGAGAKALSQADTSGKNALTDTIAGLRGEDGAGAGEQAA